MLYLFIITEPNKAKQRHYQSLHVMVFIYSTFTTSQYFGYCVTFFACKYLKKQHKNETTQLVLLAGGGKNPDSAPFYLEMD